MDLEIHDVPIDLRPQFKQRLTSYKHELERLKKEFVSFNKTITVECNRILISRF